MIGNIEIHYAGETAIDLTDPEDFKMMAILRNTEVTSLHQNQLQNTHLLMIETGFKKKILHFFLHFFLSQVSVERDRRLSLGPDALKVFNKRENNFKFKQKQQN